ncbi:hypothetical protein BU17DRAFT_68856 [Hysterangium stoloniferum]|nr:hypothetical protein BU17DRAFT_68856 [Hysterangium stoloniferum]
MSGMLDHDLKQCMEMAKLTPDQPVGKWKLHRWQPAPSGYEVIQIAHVGYIHYGSLCRLFHAALPATDPSNSLGVPIIFSPLFLRLGIYNWGEPRLALHSRSVQRKRAEAGLATDHSNINLGPPVLVFAQAQGLELLI